MPLIADPQAVSQIDVVLVASDDAWSRWSALPGDVIGTWSGEHVRVALELVASLPEADQMRCFIPRYGIRVRAESVVVAEVAFCFSCRNALVFASEHTPGLADWFTFDPESPPAVELLRLFRTLLPGPSQAPDDR